jgi:hypothetical protein
MRQPVIDDLPDLDSLPHTTCKQCGRSLINGLFTPPELLGQWTFSPRCRKCIGECNERARAKKGTIYAK